MPTKPTCALRTGAGNTDAGATRRTRIRNNRGCNNGLPGLRGLTECKILTRPSVLHRHAPICSHFSQSCVTSSRRATLLCGCLPDVRAHRPDSTNGVRLAAIAVNQEPNSIETVARQRWVRPKCADYFVRNCLAPDFIAKTERILIYLPGKKGLPPRVKLTLAHALRN